MSNKAKGHIKILSAGDEIHFEDVTVTINESGKYYVEGNMSDKVLKSPVYIAGPISGIENLNKEAFEDMEEDLILLGYGAFNPRSMSIPEGTKEEDVWHIMMKKALAGMLSCNSIILLNGWEDSKGATMEFEIAKALKMPITDQYFMRL